MADRERIEEAVGETRRTVEGFVVEAGKVAEFARAVHDPAPVYLDTGTAGDRGFDRVPAPPTFTRTAFFPRYRPEGADPERPLGFDLGLAVEYVIHGEQRYRYDRPLFVGDRLVGETTLEDAFWREGPRGGEMTFLVLRTDYRDAETDERVLRAWNTRIETEGAIRESPGGQEDDTAGGRDESPEESGDGAVAEADIVAGADAVLEDVERRDFVRYAGASGDFNPVHYDEPYATGAGFQSVFAQGMFTGGVASRAVRERVGLADLAEYRIRFTSQVFPGDTLAVTLEEGDDGDRVDLRVETDDGRTVATGEAAARE